MFVLIISSRALPPETNSVKKTAHHFGSRYRQIHSGRPLAVDTFSRLEVRVVVRDQVGNVDYPHSRSAQSMTPRAPVTDCASPIRDAIHPAEDVIRSGLRKLTRGASTAAIAGPVSPIGRDAVVRNRARRTATPRRGRLSAHGHGFAERRSCHAGAERVGEQVTGRRRPPTPTPTASQRVGRHWRPRFASAGPSRRSTPTSRSPAGRRFRGGVAARREPQSGGVRLIGGPTRRPHRDRGRTGDHRVGSVEVPGARRPAVCSRRAVPRVVTIGCVSGASYPPKSPPIV